MKENSYSRPILCIFLDILGGLAFVGGGLGVVISMAGSTVGGVAAGLSCIFSGVILIAFGQVIDFIGRTAHNSEQVANMLRTEFIPKLSALSQRTSAPSESKRSHRYFYSTDGVNNEGPFTIGELREFRSARIITDSTPVFREGATQWTTLGVLPELRSV